ncbi:DUF1289 domain-containing protein [Modicisalibacter radicis]|uniref:DUF1289 domain-containing protein n=1 Tax=Halomonas sp. EAR18 TaxID=2518972 RepID=UPI00109D5FF2|nr:DUF1289 domain-containing protein [Halomonas sp. EAR18]
MSQRIVSPCVGLCSTTVGDSVCRGCQRHESEIRDWFVYSDATRREVMQRLDAWRARIAGEYLSVSDEAQLEAQLVRHRIRHRPDQPALSRAVELLRVGRGRMRDITRYGLQAHGKGLHLSADELHKAIATALMAHAEAQRLHPGSTHKMGSLP